MNSEKETTETINNNNNNDEWDRDSSYSDDNNSNNNRKEDDENNKDQEFNIEKYIKPPNPLIEKGLFLNNEVKTAYRLNFIKIPKASCDNDNRHNNSIINVNNTHNYKDEQGYLEDAIMNDANRLTIFEYDSNKNNKNLFNLYPESDIRQIYLKYKKEKVIDLENKIYASLFIDVNKMIKNGKQYKIQYDNNNGYVKSELQSVQSNTLVFSSMFESGNLYTAFKINDNEYDLILQNDINSKGNIQWFFFNVSNTIKNSIIKFNIVNMMKPDSLFNYGMKPVVLSTLENQHNGIGWERDGTNISYTRNSILREFTNGNSTNGQQQTYYTLTFTYKFKYDQDTVYFAHCYPYTYSDLNDYLNNLCNDANTKNFVNRKVLCKTLAQNDCEYLTITSNKNIETMEQRYGIAFSARQHPGESLSSYMMQGIIDFLTSMHEEAQYLRTHCVFKIIPMLNPDGVIHGNYRTSLSGSDLNRRWKRPAKILYPTVYHAKQLIRKLKLERDTQLILDLHGHSRKKNSFIYGCTDRKNPLSSRIFPFLLSKIAPSFSFKDCRFNIEKSKESTARVALWKELKIPNVFTFEASFYGYDSNGHTYHYTKQDYMNIGKDICKALYIYMNQVVIGVTPLQQPLNMQKAQDNNNNDTSSANWLDELKLNKELLEWGEKPDDSGSDANPSEDDLPTEEIAKLCPKVYPKKREKSEKAKSSSLVIINKKNEKINSTSVNTNISEDIKKLRPKTPDKIYSKTQIPKKIQGVSNIQSLTILMRDKETQTEEIYFNTQYTQLTDSGNDCQLNTDAYSSTFISQKSISPSSKLIKIERVSNNNNNNPNDTSFGKNMAHPLSNLLSFSLQQPPHYKIQIIDRQNEKLMQNLKNIIFKTSPGSKDPNKIASNDNGSKLGSATATSKPKNFRRMTNGNLCIKGKKLDENVKEDIDIPINPMVRWSMTLPNGNQRKCSFKMDGAVTASISTSTSNSTTSKLNSGSTPLYKESITRSITNEKEIQQEVCKPLDIIALSDHEMMMLKESANVNLTINSPRSPYPNKLKMIENILDHPKSTANMIRSASKGFTNSKISSNNNNNKYQYKGSGSGKKILEIQNNNNNNNNNHTNTKQRYSQSVLPQPKNIACELYNRLGLSRKMNIEDSLEFKDDRLIKMLTNNSNNINYSSIMKNDININEVNRHWVKLNDNNQKKISEKIFSFPKEDLNGPFAIIKAKQEKKNQYFLGMNQHSKSPTKLKKDDPYSQLWNVSSYKSQNFNVKLTEFGSLFA